jgi:hypothetical protein
LPRQRDEGPCRDRKTYLNLTKLTHPKRARALSPLLSLRYSLSSPCTRARVLLLSRAPSSVAPPVRTLPTRALSLFSLPHCRRSRSLARSQKQANKSRGFKESRSDKTSRGLLKKRNMRRSEFSRNGKSGRVKRSTLEQEGSTQGAPCAARPGGCRPLLSAHTPARPGQTCKAVEPPPGASVQSGPFCAQQGQ